MKSDDATLRSFGESILQSISAGYYLSQALQRATDSFTKAQISLISTGERTGRLALVLRRLSEQMEREDNFRRQLGSALIYPTGIMIVTGLMALFMMNFMLPQLLEAENFRYHLRDRQLFGIQHSIVAIAVSIGIVGFCG